MLLRDGVSQGWTSAEVVTNTRLRQPVHTGDAGHVNYANDDVCTDAGSFRRPRIWPATAIAFRVASLHERSCSSGAASCFCITRTNAHTGCAVGLNADMTSTMAFQSCRKRLVRETLLPVLMRPPNNLHINETGRRVARYFPAFAFLCLTCSIGLYMLTKLCDCFRTIAAGAHCLQQKCFATPGRNGYS